MSHPPDRLREALSDRYELDRELGAGGMATVYLAHDSKHDRKVAIKVLRPDLAAIIGAERFLSEIRTTANLQHPHILPLYDSGAADGFLFYVMPFIDGETVRDRLNTEKQLPIADAIRITTEVAGALHYAHRQGVIHRDIKPENILLHDGSALVADFGIALAASKAGGSRMTETGMSLGTPHYMSPEQAMGEREITARADVYALGCVTYEMLIGEPPFTGPTAQAIVAKVLTEKPASLVARRDRIPLHVEAAVMNALEKLPADRFSSAAEFAQALGNSSFSTATAPARSAPPSRNLRRNRALIIVGALAAVATGVALLGWLRPAPAHETTWFDVHLGEAALIPNSDVVVSPDGSMFAFAGRVEGRRWLYVRKLGEAEFTRVRGAENVMVPAFSPDSRSIIYRDDTRNALLIVDVTGASSRTLVKAGVDGLGSPYDPHWGSPDWIVFVTQDGLHRVRASGGLPEQLNGGGRHPFLLPDGSGVLHARGGNVSLLDIDTDSSAIIVPSAANPYYVETGHILYTTEEGSLFAAPFDAGTGKVTAPGIRIMDRVSVRIGRRGFSVSRNGMLLFQRGPIAEELEQNSLVMMDMSGKGDTLKLPGGRRNTVRFAPNGRSIAYEFRTKSRGANSDIYTFDMVTGTNTQLTFDGDNDDPVWSPDGTHIVFTRDGPENDEELYVKPVNNSAPESRILAMNANQNPAAWIRGDTIVFNSISGGNSDLYFLKLGKDAKPQEYLTASWSERDVALSPDHALAAVTSFESGARDIWIRTWPNPEGKWRVSAGGGYGGMRWSPDGRALYFWREGEAAATLYRARIDRSAGVAVRTPELVMTVATSSIFDWDLHPDGRRLIVPTHLEDESSRDTPADEQRRIVVLNWFNELRALTSRAR